MRTLDPYDASYPAVEQRCWTDVFPGMMFCFRKHIGRIGDTNLAFNDKDTVWTVVSIESVYPGNRDDCHRYLLLGSSGALAWHHGSLGWIQRIADPACELRLARWRAEARAKETAVTLLDTALALAC